MRKLRKGAALLAAVLTFNLLGAMPVQAADTDIEAYLAAANACPGSSTVTDAKKQQEFLEKYADVETLYAALSTTEKQDARVTAAAAKFDTNYIDILKSIDATQGARTDNYKVGSVTFQFDNTMDSLTTTNANGKVEIFKDTIVEFADQYKKTITMANVEIPFKHAKDKYGYEYPSFTDVWDTLALQKFYDDNGLTGANDPKLDPNDAAYDATLKAPNTIGRPLTGWQLDRVSINGVEFAISDTFVIPALANCTAAGGAEDLDIVYYYVPAFTYTLTFDLAGGSTTNNAYKTQTKSSIKSTENWEVIIEKNPDGSFKNAPTKADSTFVGFRLNNEPNPKVDTFTIPMAAGTGDTYKLTAEWRTNNPVVGNKWTASLELDGNIPNEAHVQSEDREVDEANTSYNFTLARAAWTYAGHTFQGWATSATATAPDYAAGDVVTVTKDNPALKLYAVWKDDNVADTDWSPSITYNINVQGSTVAPKTVTLPATSNATTTVKIEANTFTNDGYNFKNWNSQADGKGTAYTVGNDVQISKDQPRLVLYAQWDKKPEEWEATVKYTLNGGSGSISNDTAKETASTHEFTVKKPEGISRDGFQFTGWNTKSDGTGTTYAAESKIVVTKENPSNELFAQWKEVKKWTGTIKYNANGGSGSIAEQKQEVTDKDKVTMTIKGIDGITNSGYTFSHWNTKADDSGQKYSANTTWDATEKESTLELYAIWKKVDPWKATVKYDLNGGTGTLSDSTADVNNSDKQDIKLADSKDLKRDGYTFKEWNTKADGTGTAYQPGENFSVTMAQPTVTIYAIWVDKDGKVATSNTNQTGGNKVDGALGGVNVPKTADESNIIWHAIFILLGLAGIAGVVGFELFVPRKKRN